MALVEVKDIVIKEYKIIYDDNDREHSYLANYSKIATYVPSLLPLEWRDFNFRDSWNQDFFMLRGYFPEGYPRSRLRYDSASMLRTFVERYPNGKPLTDPAQIAYFEYFSVVMEGSQYASNLNNLDEETRYVDSFLIKA